ncbi:VTC domain-containing protein [Phycomyces blakesleeanus]|uniref:VTC domain-containing protein n=1 Tax=Phycomyces blakesleeanus TaxID=4837 RepID=A0ABR3AKU8_PHYBL
MKFAEQLAREAFPPWRTHYIKYGLLKAELKNRQADHEWNEEDEKYFTRMLEQELDNVYNTVVIKLEDINSRIKYCDATIQTLKNSQSWSSDESWESTETILTETLFDLNDLAKFIRLNYTGFRKIIKKHDRWATIKLANGFVPQLRDKPLDTQQLDVPIVYISNLKDICNRRGKPHAGNAAAGGDQLNFERATSKYWIHPDNINEVKSIIMMHLPVLIFDSEKKFEPDDSAISSIYFDSPEFDLYTDRLQRDDNGEAIRFRWYGPTSSKSVFVERKTHHASWLNGKSIKDRFRLDTDDVQRFVKGELTAETIVRRLEAKGDMDKVTLDNIYFIAEGIQESIKNKNLAPVCRVFYNRTAFQIPGDQRVRISLDTNLTFIREDNLDGMQRRGQDEWRRSDIGINYPFNGIPKSDIAEFPHGVLETKLQTHLNQQPPEWLTKLLESHLVHEVTRFSKYLHGVAYLFPESIPLVPWWLAELEQDIRKPRSTNFGLSRSPSFRPMINGEYGIAWEAEQNRMKATSSMINNHLSQRVTNSLGEQVNMVGLKNNEKPSNDTLKVPTDTNSNPIQNAHNPGVDLVSPPATLHSVLQEEVTFPQQTSYAGAVFIGIAVCVCFYALYRFEKRAWMLNNNVKGRYDDMIGPAVLCVFLVGALVVNLYLRFTTPKKT